MDTTPNLALPYILAAQAQKHVTHNEAIRALDALVQITALDRDLTTPPSSPNEGDRYIVAAGATGAWSGQSGGIAAWQDGAWAFYAPVRGWLAWIADESALLVFDGATWTAAAPPASLQDVPMIGINATADATTRLALAAAASLFSHAGAGHQQKINKATAADTASQLYQTGFSGRAEFGLCGDDDFHVKVSPDGSTWREAIVAAKSDGAVRFPCGVADATTLQPLRGLVFTPGGTGQNSIYRNDTARAQDPRSATISSVASDVITVSGANDALLFYYDSYMRNVSYARIWNTSKSPAQSAWVKAQPAGNQLQVTAASDISTWAGGETIQLGDPVPGVVPTRAFALDISPMLQQLFGTVFRQSGILCKATAGGTSNRTAINISEAAVTGSFTGVNSLSDGELNGGMLLIACSVQSPISNSNLVFVREDAIAPATLGTCLLSSIAVVM